MEQDLSHFKLNWRPDLPDQRDFLYQITAPQSLPDVTDLRVEMPPVFNQGRIGSCTANAVSGALGYLYMLQLKMKGKQPEEFSSKRYLPASRLFIYYNSRSMIGMEKVDSGAYLRDAVKSVNQLGVCREDKWKYETARLFKKPTKGPVMEASQYKITQYQRLQGLEQYKDCLAQGFPFVFGFTVYESFYNVSSLGVVAMPSRTEKAVGGHAVLAVGYQEDRRMFIVRNSWGDSWGDKGYMYMPYDYVTSTLASDFWTIKV